MALGRAMPIISAMRPHVASISSRSIALPFQGEQIIRAPFRARAMQSGEKFGNFGATTSYLTRAIHTAPVMCSLPKKNKTFWASTLAKKSQLKARRKPPRGASKARLKTEKILASQDGVEDVEFEDEEKPGEPLMAGDLEWSGPTVDLMDEKFLESVEGLDWRAGAVKVARNVLKTRKINGRDPGTLYITAIKAGRLKMGKVHEGSSERRLFVTLDVNRPDIELPKVEPEFTGKIPTAGDHFANSEKAKKLREKKEREEREKLGLGGVENVEEDEEEDEIDLPLFEEPDRTRIILQDIIDFTNWFDLELKKAGIHDLDIEVGSPGADRDIAIPEGFKKFGDQFMRIKYRLPNPNFDESQGALGRLESDVLQLTAIDYEAGTSTWKFPDIKASWDKYCQKKGMRLNRQMRMKRLELDFKWIESATLHMDFRQNPKRDFENF